MSPPRNKGERVDIETVLDRIRDARNIDFRNYKRATLRRRVERRMHDRHKRTLSEYLHLLDAEPAEYDALLGSMLIKVTSFFRDKELWDVLSTKIVPQMLAEKRPGEEIRIWCAGCATGEEAFSIAILLAEAMGPAFSNQDIKVFGSDVDEKAISTARRGVYRKESMENVSPKMLKDWFVEEAGGWSVRKEIRRCVVFGINNLVSDAPISRLDMLLCRNVFIYLDNQLQKRVLTRFHYALRRNGILVLGKSELIPFAAKIYEPVDLSRRIYRKDGRGSVTLQQERLVGLLEQESTTHGEEPPELGATELFHRDVVQGLRQPVVVTAVDGTIMLWNSAAAELWGRREGEMVGKRLAALNLPGLSGELLIEKTAMVREGRSEREMAAGTLGGKGQDGGTHLLVDVSALRNAGRELKGLLYSVQDLTEYRALESELRKVSEERQSALEELQTLNEEMQSSNEELETTNEELQSANEELQTTNEELQSTNEELETTNEELQSTNAELDATNRELAHRTEELNRLGFAQRPIIRSLSSAVITLDASGRITLWNLAAERLLGLTETEAVGQVLWTLHVPALPRPAMARLRKALGQNNPVRNELIDYELPTGGTGRASVAAIPIVDGGAPLGAVVIFDDITRAVALAAQNKARDGQKKREARETK